MLKRQLPLLIEVSMIKETPYVEMIASTNIRRTNCINFEMANSQNANFEAVEIAKQEVEYRVELFNKCSGP